MAVDDDPNYDGYDAIAAEDDSAEDDGGVLRVRVDITPLQVPEARVVGDAIEFEGDKWPSQRRVPEGLLDKFVRPAMGSNRAIKGFATKYGPLGLFEINGEVRPAPERLFADTNAVHIEALGWWREFRHDCLTLLVLMAFLRDKAKVRLSDFERVQKWLKHPSHDAEGVATYDRQTEWSTGISEDEPLRDAFREWNASSRKNQRFDVSRALRWRLNRLVNWCRVHPFLYPDDEHTRMHLRFGVGDDLGSLSGALAAQLVALAQGGGWGICPACREPFNPSVKHRTYCAKPQCTKASKDLARLKDHQIERDEREFERKTGTRLPRRADARRSGKNASAKK